MSEMERNEAGLVTGYQLCKGTWAYVVVLDFTQLMS